MYSCITEHGQRVGEQSSDPRQSVQLHCDIMAEGFLFMLLGLVRLRTFRLSAWVT